MHPFLSNHLYYRNPDRRYIRRNVRFPIESRRYEDNEAVIYQPAEDDERIDNEILDIVEGIAYPVEINRVMYFVNQPIDDDDDDEDDDEWRSPYDVYKKIKQLYINQHIRDRFSGVAPFIGPVQPTNAPNIILEDDDSDINEIGFINHAMILRELHRQASIVIAAMRNNANERINRRRDKEEFIRWLQGVNNGVAEPSPVVNQVRVVKRKFPIEDDDGVAEPSPVVNQVRVVKRKFPIED